MEKTIIIQRAWLERLIEIADEIRLAEDTDKIPNWSKDFLWGYIDSAKSLLEEPPKKEP